MIVFTIMLAFMNFVNCALMVAKSMTATSAQSCLGHWLLATAVGFMGSLLLWEAIKEMVRYFREGK